MLSHSAVIGGKGKREKGGKEERTGVCGNRDLRYIFTGVSKSGTTDYLGWNRRVKASGTPSGPPRT